MSNTVSKAVADRVAINNTIISAIQVHGPEFIPQLEKELFPNGPPANLKTEDFVNAFAGILMRENQKLITADLEHAGELTDDDQYRRNRDEHIAGLRQLLYTLRNNLLTGYGANIAAAYGLKEALPEDANVLMAYAANAVEHFGKRPLSEPCKYNSMLVNPAAAAGDINAAAALLKTSLEDVEREKREAQVTMVAKNQALAAWSPRYQQVANATVSFCGIGGCPALGERVKPTTRRRAGLPEEEDLEAQSTPPADPSAPAAPATPATPPNA